MTYTIITIMMKNLLDPDPLAQTTGFGSFILGDIG